MVSYRMSVPTKPSAILYLNKGWGGGAKAKHDAPHRIFVGTQNGGLRF